MFYVFSDFFFGLSWGLNFGPIPKNGKKKNNTGIVYMYTN